MRRIYLETNFLMSASTGRTPEADELLSLPENVELAIPIVCFMELHKTFSYMRASELRFTEPFPKKIEKIGQDPNPRLREFTGALAAADAALFAYIDESARAMPDVVQRTAMRANLITSSREVLSRTGKRYLSDPTDDMIAGSVIEHAHKNPVSEMAFFSEDGDFAKPSLVDAMRGVNVGRLDDISSCLAWCRT